MKERPIIFSGESVRAIITGRKTQTQRDGIAGHSREPVFPCWYDGVNYHDTPRQAYAALWDRINAKRVFPWSSNPWVWVVEFRRAA